MKNIVKIIILLCLTACMLLSVVSCNLPFGKAETTTSDEAITTTAPQENDTNDVYKLEIQTVFEAAKKAGYTGTLEELIAMFKGETGPAGTDGVTPHIGVNGNWWVGETDLGVSAQGIQGPQGEQGDKGDKGDPGRGILRMELVNGELIVYYTDGTSQNLGSITGGTTEKENLVYIVKVTDENNQPIAGVELLLYCSGTNGGTYINLPATAANGYTYSPFIEQKDYVVRVTRADGYQFDSDFEYSFIQNSNVAYITLSSKPVTPPSQEEDIEMPEKVDMDGYIYRAYVRDFAGTDPDALMAQINNGNNDYRCVDFWVDEANSNADVISYAVYGRNQQIEADYNCKIRQVASDGDQVEFLVSAFQNGTGYDLTIMMAKRAAQAATQNLLKNLKASTYMDLTRESFDQNAIKELSVKDKLYFISGDMNISTMDVAGLSIVNMDLYEDYAEDIVNELYGGDQMYSNIYNVVLAKKWTMETLLTIATKANIDVDKSDGALHATGHGIGANHEVVDNKYRGGDRVGYHQYLYSALWYFYGSGGRITQMNEEGVPEFVVTTPSANELYDYIYSNFNRRYNATWIPHESSDVLNFNFLSGEVLFADMSLFNIRNEIYPAAQFEYGILPIPVLEEGMDYQSVVYFNNWAHLWAIPAFTNNDEYAERMMEIMAIYSSLPGSTMEAYYDRTVYLLAAKDNGSRQVMDMIKSSLVYDIALLYPEWGNIEMELIQIPNEEYGYAGIVETLPRVEDQMFHTIEMLLYPELGW